MMEPPPSPINPAVMSFDEWIKRHEELLDILVITSRSDKVTADKFKSIRNKRHINNAYRLSQFGEMLRKLDDSLERRLYELEKKYKPKRMYKPYYQDNQINIIIRKMRFLRESSLHMMVTTLTDHINNVLRKMTQTIYLTELYTNNLPDENTIIEIKDQFYKVKPNEKMELHSKMLHCHYKIYKKKVLSLPKPPYIKNPKQFFIKLKNEAMTLANGTSYFGFIPDEIGFSHYLFDTDSKEGSTIDDFIFESTKTDFEYFGETAISLCSGLIPEAKTVEEQSVMILILFRQIMERAYEKTYKYFPYRSKKALKQYHDIGNYPLSSLPEKSVLPPFPQETPIRDAALFDPTFKFAVSTFLDCLFYSNPVDILHHISMSLTKMWGAALTTRLGRDPNQSELGTVAGFEEMFSLMFTGMIGSEIPDPFWLNSYVTRLQPISRLSPNLEFAVTYLSVTMQHISQLTGISLDPPPVPLEIRQNSASEFELHLQERAIYPPIRGMAEIREESPPDPEAPQPPLDAEAEDSAPPSAPLPIESIGSEAVLRLHELLPPSPPSDLDLGRLIPPEEMLPSKD